MSLPKVSINYTNGALGRVVPSADGVYGIVATGVAVTGKFALLTNYLVTSLDQVVALGIEATGDNAGLYKVMKDFYSQAPEGTEVWIRAFADTVTMSQMLDKDIADNAKALLLGTNGRLKGIFAHRTPAGTYEPVVTSGIDGDVITAIAKAQLLAEYATETLKAPIFVAIAGLAYQDVPATLPDLTERTDNRVAVMIGDTVSGTGCAIGLLAGRLASVPVQRNIGRVKDGAVISESFGWVGTKKVEDANIELMHDNGFITLCQHVGRAGYFFTDDPLATLPTDDYNGIAVRRVIDKAYRLAYAAMTDELLNEVSVNDAGQVSISYAKSIENKVENAIINSMTVNGELGNDPQDQNDTGVECLVDPTQNVVATNKIIVGLRVKPFGYAKYIEVNLGFKIITQ
jgi:hypothetical protein